MRVLVVSPWPSWDTLDGNGLVLHRQLPLWARHHEVSVLIGGLTTTVPPGQPVETLALGDDRSGGLDYLLRRTNEVREREPAHAQWTLRRRLLAEVHRRLPLVDVLHLHGWGTAGLAGLAPSVHVPFDPWADSVANRVLPGWRKVSDAGEVALIRRHERRHYPRCGTVVLVSDTDADAVRRQAPGTRAAVVPNGVEPGPTPAPLPAEPLLVFHGTLATRANATAAVELARRILPRVQAEVPGARLALVGRDPLPEVAALAGPDVTVTGAVPDVRPWLDRAAVYVAPMTEGHGLKNKVLEAMAAGRPVVASQLALGGIGAGEGIVVADGAAAGARAVVDLLRDRDRAAAIGTAGRTRVERDFSWATNAARIEELWTEVADRWRAHRNDPV